MWYALHLQCTVIIYALCWNQGVLDIKIFRVLLNLQNFEHSVLASGHHLLHRSPIGCIIFFGLMVHNSLAKLFYLTLHAINFIIRFCFIWQHMVFKCWYQALYWFWPSAPNSGHRRCYNFTVHTFLVEYPTLEGGDNWAKKHGKWHRTAVCEQLLPEIEKAESVTPQTSKFRYRRVISDQWIHWKFKKKSFHSNITFVNICENWQK